MRFATLLLAVLAGTASAAFAGGPSFLINGTLDGGYGAALATQTVQTQFGDASASTPAFTNGSELDGLYVASDGTNLYLFLSGNLESNYNKLEIFVDSRDGGQNVLRADNHNVDFDGLNHLSGLVFDAGFEPDYYLTMSGGDQVGVYGMFVSGAELLATGGGNGGYMGTTGAASDGVLTGGDYNVGLRMTIDNSNTAGVTAGCNGETPGSVMTGVEMTIPLDSLEWTPGNSLKVCAWINGSSHDFLSNQVLPGLPSGTCNLGDPHNVNFTTLAGDQFVTVSRTTPVTPATWGRIKLRYR